jgi:hypothetical protein
MLTDRWHEIERLYHSARQQEPEERANFLNRACPSDELLRREVESLLAHDEPAAGFLENKVPEAAPIPPGTLGARK